MIATDYQDRDGNNKTRWTKIGTAWPAKTGTGYSIVLDALPMPSMSRDGKMECRILLREPLERDTPRSNGTPARNNRAPVDDDLDQDIPF